MKEEERVIREWLDGQVNPLTGGPRSPGQRLSQPLPRRRVPAVVQTLVAVIDEERALKEQAIRELRYYQRVVVGGLP